MSSGILWFFSQIFALKLCQFIFLTVYLSMLEYRFLFFNWGWTKLFWFCPEHYTLQYCERDGWELLGAQGEFLQW